ncbi:ComEC/Rec2 family competence protein, partial [Salmonella enterica]
VMSAGFWLSFGAVAIIFIAAQMALDGHRSENAGWVGATRRALAGGTRIQFAVTFGLLPLTLLLFQQTSVVSVAANGLAIPAVSFVTTPLALIGAALPDPLAQPVLALAEASFRWLVVWLEWLAKPRWSV